jgi:predicted RNA-binding Zn ribbon-like protein
MKIASDSEITGHWLSYLKGAFALANGFGPSWAGGRPYSRPDTESVVRAIRGALAHATVEPPTLVLADAELMARTGEDLWKVFDAVAGGRLDDAVHQTNAMLASIAPQPALTRHGPAGNWHLHFTAAAEGEGQRWASDVIVAAAMLQGSEAWGRTGRCGAVRCERVFLDQTRNHSQQFCSTHCQDRTKTAARRHRRREHASADAATPSREGVLR